MYKEEAAVIKETRISGSLASFLKALISAVVFTAVMFLVFSLLICYTPLSDSIIPAVSLSVMVISVLICAAVSTRSAKSKGYLKGCLSGLAYVSVIYLVSAIFSGGIYFNAYVILLLSIGIFVGSIGGILGINMKDKRRR